MIQLGVAWTVKPPFAAVALVAVAATPSVAVVSGTLEVSQTIIAGDAIEIGTMTYVGFSDFWNYPAEVVYTASQSIIAGEDRNAASLLGIRISLVPRSDAPLSTSEDFRDHGVFGDTLRVVMDLTDLDPSFPGRERIRGAISTWDVVVAKTVDCILLNARRSWPRVRFVDLAVLGPSEYTRLAGTHSLAEVPQPASFRYWQSWPDSLMLSR
jgi:hypothetical protein